MNIRERLEALEEKVLSPYASLSKNSKGRVKDEEPCDIRTPYQRDRDRIIHSKAFRRLMHKTQVFIAPEGDHYRTRLTHTLEVAQIARTVARALALNEDLTEAIALGHDLGHTPFGHAGEAVLDTICPVGFKHYEQSIRIVEHLANNGNGLNLSWEVKDGILNHPTKGSPSTMEGQIVRYADKIAYINHDIDDAVRGKIMKEEDLPKDIIAILGGSPRTRINTMIHDMVEHSEDKDSIIMSNEVQTAMLTLRKYMFDHVYIGSTAKDHEKKAQNMLEQLYNHFYQKPVQMPDEYQEMIDSGENIDRVVCDYISGMTDPYAIRTFYELFIPSTWKEL
ncbi:MAG: deoxyguanosinetriphosphate triphosphohydrolase [Vallitaleaceae bacterium]|jgi:dGTPase|nr:deoxyguanosinetriphosphate triphosphohydrolase [Vallitaleaceae bacterium]